MPKHKHQASISTKKSTCKQINHQYQETRKLKRWISQTLRENSSEDKSMKVEMRKRMSKKVATRPRIRTRMNQEMEPIGLHRRNWKMKLQRSRT